MLARTLLLSTTVLLSGCGMPNKANIELRKENDALKEKIAHLESENAAARARIEGLDARAASPATQRTLDAVFTVHEIKLGRLSAASATGIKLYLTPQDQDGDPTKAPGRVTVDAYDLADPQNRLLGHWDVATADIRPRWRSLGPLQAFVLELPWKAVPATTREVSVKVMFEDALTGRIFRLVQKVTWQ